MTRITMLHTVSHVPSPKGYVNYYQGQEYIVETDVSRELAEAWVGRRLADWTDRPKRVLKDRVQDGN